MLIMDLGIVIISIVNTLILLLLSFLSSPLVYLFVFNFFLGVH